VLINIDRIEHGFSKWQWFIFKYTFSWTQHMENRKGIFLAALVVMCITLPYGIAAFSGNQQVFNGFLLNPIDGNSYLAKMYQGWEGSWRFRLTYTSQSGEGAYLFLFYIFLGHLARWTGIPLIAAFHLARITSAVLLVFVMQRFFSKVFPDRPAAAWTALLLATLGSGLGWLAALAGYMTSDFWVAEAFPFLSSYSNPHFPLGMAILLLVFLKAMEPVSRGNLLYLFILGLLLAVIMPFGMVIAVVVYGALWLWNWIETRRFNAWSITALGSGGGIYLLYQVWISNTDPILAGWNAQNLTFSPPVWDVILSFCPILVLGVFAIRPLWQARNRAEIRLMIVWIVLGFLLVYVPFSLQRRFMFALYIPVVAVGVFGLQEARKKLHGARWLVPLLMVLSCITNLGILMAGVASVQEKKSSLFYSSSEAQAMAWIEKNTSPDALVLSGPEMGLYIPAHTGRSVIYGHPFETVSSVTEKENLRLFFSGVWDQTQAEQFLESRQIDYILYGPREEKIGFPSILKILPAVYQVDGISIYKGYPGP
jgi:hypothetical protein